MALSTCPVFAHAEIAPCKSLYCGARFSLSCLRARFAFPRASFAAWAVCRSARLLILWRCAAWGIRDSRAPALTGRKSADCRFPSFVPPLRARAVASVQGHATRHPPTLRPRSILRSRNRILNRPLPAKKRKTRRTRTAQSRKRNLETNRHTTLPSTNRRARVRRKGNHQGRHRHSFMK